MKKKLNPKMIFWIRFAITVIIGIFTPFIYLIARYNLFQKEYKVSVGLFGVVAVILLCVAILVLIKFYISGMKTKYSWFKQIVEGFSKLIIPIIIVITCMYVLKGYTSQIIEFCWILIPCELVAICVNPLPKWAFDNNVDGLAEISDKIFRRNKGTTDSEGAEK